jgi:hypothetical protein
MINYMTLTLFQTGCMTRGSRNPAGRDSPNMLPPNRCRAYPEGVGDRYTKEVKVNDDMKTTLSMIGCSQNSYFNMRSSIRDTYATHSLQ